MLPTDLPEPEIVKREIRIQGLDLSIEDMVVEGDKVWARMVARGTDPRSGEPVTIDVLDVYRFEDGRMVEHGGIPDRFRCFTSSGSCQPLRPRTSKEGLSSLAPQAPGHTAWLRAATVRAAVC